MTVCYTRDLRILLRHHSNQKATDMQTSLCSGYQPGLSFDGYVRLTFDALAWLTFRHKKAWEDAELVEELRTENLPATRAGYCEWETDNEVMVSVGWTWFAIGSGLMFIAPGGVSSNLMLVSPQHYDLGASRTSVLLQAWLSGVAWQPEVVQASF